MATPPIKGTVNQEKWPRDEVLDTSLNKKGKIDDSKGNKALLPKETKKKVTWRFKETPAAAPREGTSGNSGATLGHITSMQGSPSVVENILGE